MRRSSASPAIAAGDLEAIGALESGNWRIALRMLGAGRVADAFLGTNLRTVARAMAFRAAGEHGRAWETLGIAAAGIARHQPGVPVVTTDVVRLALPPEHAGPAFRTVRLIWREQSELSNLRSLAADRPSGMPQDRHILVLAFVEYLSWLELDLDTSLTELATDEGRPLVGQQLSELRDRRREGFLRSATDLRQLPLPRAGTMTKTVWGRAGGYHGLRRLALLELAERPEPPWTDSPAPASCPARTGARMAWMLAQAA
ncbi:hypothetical protein [Kribbella sp. C-35]|uniref:hypothetical protein n=1 Tax=Kribbella sp. C-35 TaxID=2789276 RepID=UPI00397BF89C